MMRGVNVGTANTTPARHNNNYKLTNYDYGCENFLRDGAPIAQLLRLRLHYLHISAGGTAMLLTMAHTARTVISQSPREMRQGCGTLGK